MKIDFDLHAEIEKNINITIYSNLPRSYYYASKELKLFCFQTDMNIVHRISKSEYIS